MTEFMTGGHASPSADCGKETFGSASDSRKTAVRPTPMKEASGFCLYDQTAG